MAFKITWTNDAKENFRSITNYLLEEWNFEVADKFSDKLIEATLQLEKMPFLGKKHSELSAVRQLIIAPHNLLYYTIIDTDIVILNILDSRIRK